MPKHLQNWTFEDVAAFLKQNYFSIRNIEGSHHYFVGFVDGKDRICHIQKHGRESIRPKTLKINVIEKSGIPLELWLQWSSSPNNLRKKIVYKKSSIRIFSETPTPLDTNFVQTEGEEIKM